MISPVWVGVIRRLEDSASVYNMMRNVGLYMADVYDGPRIGPDGYYRERL